MLLETRSTNQNQYGKLIEIVENELIGSEKSKFDLDNDNINEQLDCILESQIDINSIINYDKLLDSAREADTWESSKLEWTILLRKIQDELEKVSIPASTKGEKDDEQSDNGQEEETEEEECSEEEEEEEEGFSPGRITEHSRWDDIVEFYSSHIRTFIVLKPFFFTVDKTKALLSYVWEQFLKLIDLIAKLLTADVIYDAIDVLKEKSKILAVIIVFVATVIDAIVQITVYLLILLSWLANPFGKLFKKIRSRLKGDSSSGNEDSGETETDIEGPSTQ